METNEMIESEELETHLQRRFGLIRKSAETIGLYPTIDILVNQFGLTFSQAYRYTNQHGKFE